MKAYVLVFHDVWDTAEEEPSEDVSVSGVFASLEAAEGARDMSVAHWLGDTPTRDYYSIEEFDLNVDALRQEHRRDAFSTVLEAMAAMDLRPARSWLIRWQGLREWLTAVRGDA